MKRLSTSWWALVGCVGLVLVDAVRAASATLLGNRGPLFYRQPRVGKNGETFGILKFRTMRAERRRSTSGRTRGRSAHHAVRSALRRTHLDELPQVVNILRGDLSVVGPRPEQPHYVEELDEKLPFYDLRHLVRPGLTGWAQVKYGYAGDEQRRAREAAVRVLLPAPPRRSVSTCGSSGARSAARSGAGADESAAFAVFTSTHADLWPLRPVIDALLEWPGVDTHVIATGTHLSSDFGATLSEIGLPPEQVELVPTEVPLDAIADAAVGVSGPHYQRGRRGARAPASRSVRRSRRSLRNARRGPCRDGAPHSDRAPARR